MQETLGNQEEKKKEERSRRGKAGEQSDGGIRDKQIDGEDDRARVRGQLKHRD